MAEQEFNLEGLMKLNYDYDLLKQVLEYLLARDKTVASRLSVLEKDLADVKNEIALYLFIINLRTKSMPKTVPSMPEFVALKQKLNKLEERVYSHDSKFAEQQTLLDTTNFNMKMMQMTVNTHDENIAECIFDCV